MIISDRIAALEESATLQVAALCQQLRSQGVDVIGLSLGEPDFPAPAHVKQAAIDAVNNDISHYGPTPGFPALRQAIAASLNRDIEAYPVRPYDANEIVVSVGAKQALCNAIEALIGPGDEVIMPTPCWVSYVEMVKIAQGKSVLVRTTMENNFCLTAEQLEAAITPNTKLLMLCSPNNPTGSVYTLDNLKALVEVLKRHPQVVVLADEIYQHILYTGKHETLAQFPELEDRLEKSGKTELRRELRAIADMANITFIRQKELRGLGHAVMHARGFTGDEPFAVLLGDDIMRSDVPVTKQLSDNAEKYGCSCVGVKYVETSEISKYCTLGVKPVEDRLFDVNQLIEKPTPDKLLSNYAILGRYVLTSGIYELLENAKPGFGGEIQLTDALNLLCQKERMLALDFEGKRFDSGNICGYMEASIQLALENPEVSGWLKNYMKGLSL